MLKDKNSPSNHFPLAPGFRCCTIPRNWPFKSREKSLKRPPRIPKHDELEFQFSAITGKKFGDSPGNKLYVGPVSMLPFVSYVLTDCKVFSFYITIPLAMRKHLLCQ